MEETVATVTKQSVTKPDIEEKKEEKVAPVVLPAASSSRLKKSSKG